MLINDAHYIPGTIWYVRNFNFGVGIQTRDKYILILKVDKATESVCYACCTTRKRYGTFSYPKHGCNPFKGLSTSFFAASHVIGAKNSFSFPDPTHVYHGYDIYIVHYSDLEVYHIDGRVEICDEMTKEEFDTVLECLRESDSAIRKLKRFLFS